MRFWLAAFVVLFAAVELFNWVTQLGSLHASGIWLLLGGMGLAALSNMAHWSIATGAAETEEEEATPTDTNSSEAHGQTTELPAGQGQKVESLAEKSAQDSISFKVRPLKR